MAIRKIDTVEYKIFLSRVKTFIDSLELCDLSQYQSIEKDIINNYVVREQDIMELKEQRKLYYTYFSENRSKDPEGSSLMFNKYIEVKNKLKEYGEVE